MASAYTLNDAGPVFLGAQRHLNDACIALVGVPFDGTASFRAGARLGPDAIRAGSQAIETYSPHLDRDLDDIALSDLGNIEVGSGRPELLAAQLEHVTADLLANNATPLLLGGDHSWTPGVVRALLKVQPDLVVVQFDAHADLRDGFLGEPYSHASGMRRCLDTLASDALLQVGIRSGTRDEWRELRDTQRYVLPTAEALRAAVLPFAGRPMYLTCDLDIFDPASCAGTGVPEPGGIDWPTFEALLDVLSVQNLVGADVVELAPNLDPSGASSILAAKVVREVALLLGR